MPHPEIAILEKKLNLKKSNFKILHTSETDQASGSHESLLAYKFYSIVIKNEFSSRAVTEKGFRLYSLFSLECKFDHFFL